MILSYLASVAASGDVIRWRTATPLSLAQGWRWLRRNRQAMFCLILLAVMAIVVRAGARLVAVGVCHRRPEATSRPGRTLAEGPISRCAMSTTRLLLAGTSADYRPADHGDVGVPRHLLGALSGYVGGLTDKLITRGRHGDDYPQVYHY